jgi:integrase
MITQDDATVMHANRACIGPLAPHIEEFEAHLVRAGYVPYTVQTKRELILHLSRWLKRRKIPLVRLDEEQLRRFQISHHRRLGKRHGDMWTIHQLLLYLRNIGRVAAPLKRIDRTALGRLIRDFEEFLSSERGLSRATVMNYVSVTRRFLIEHFGDKPLRLKTLRPRDIHRFIIHCGLVAKPIISALRSFLRFLHQRGAITIDLAAAVPAVANWRLSHLPKSLPPKQVKQLLASSDRHTSTGQRDYAILLLMARLGLRSRRSGQHDFG